MKEEEEVLRAMLFVEREKEKRKRKREKKTVGVLRD